MLGKKLSKTKKEIKEAVIAIFKLFGAWIKSFYLRYKKLPLKKQFFIDATIFIILMLGVVKCFGQDELKGRQFDPSIDPCGMWYNNDCKNMTTQCMFKFSEELFDANDPEMLESCLNLFSVCAQHSVPVMCNDKEPIDEEPKSPFDLFNEENELIY